VQGVALDVVQIAGEPDAFADHGQLRLAFARLLLVNAWNGGVAVTDSLILLAPTLAWVVVAVLLASRLFRWEPRR
jgi:ABC-2 type transport system permease protein